MKPITSRDNPGFKALRALSHSARDRKTLRQTVLDGPHLLAALLDAGGTPLQVWVREGAQSNAEIAALLPRIAPNVCFTLPDALFKEAAPTDAPAGVLAVMAIPEPPPTRETSHVIVLDGVQDAGNVGSILRSAAAAGVAEAWLSPGCAVAWSPRVLRAGMGAHFAITLRENAPVASWLGSFPGRVIATTLDASTSLFDAPLNGPLVWLFGSEGAGVSDELLALASQQVAIPMPGRLESLNVAAAAAVCLFEVVRRAGV